jgi:ribosome maturation factor RimP
LVSTCKNQDKNCIFAPSLEKKIEGTPKSPLFILKMFREKVIALLDSCFENRSDLFLIDLEILSDYTIRVIIDGDNGVSVEDCVYVSRAVEHNLDREAYDFSIEVSSAGAASDLINKRQYKRNIGRTLKLKTKTNGTIEAELFEVKDDGIIVKWKTREPKPVGKGKVTVVNEAEINYDDIEKANVVLKF